ncbi:hypothetical protein LguiA_022225 [Lonicera macranthoides]
MGNYRYSFPSMECDGKSDSAKVNMSVTLGDSYSGQIFHEGNFEKMFFSA